MVDQSGKIRANSEDWRKAKQVVTRGQNKGAVNTLIRNFVNYIGNFWKSFPKNFEDFEKYFEHFREVFWKISRNIFQNNFAQYSGNFRELFRNIVENFEYYFRKSREILLKFWKNIQKFWELLRRIWRIISYNNFKNYIGNVRKWFQKILDIFAKYFGKYWEIFP